MNDFLRMGGYGWFVWPSYALGIAVLVWNIVTAVAGHRSARERALRRLALHPTSDSPAPPGELS